MEELTREKGRKDSKVKGKLDWTVREGEREGLSLERERKSHWKQIFNVRSI